ncbi:MAG: orotidine-5'-phosphate decarboxylase [Sphingomicrobium sp.]
MSPIFVAIDTPDLTQALELAKGLGSTVGGVKLGLEFFAANGPAGVAEVARAGLPIFLDLKLHDIPNTVASAMRALAPLNPAIVTVHAAGGRTMLEQAKAAAPEATKVVAVTMLTSLDENDLVEMGITQGRDGNQFNFVTRLAKLARSANVDGIVCSGEEVGGVRDLWPDGFLVVPGLRPEGTAVGDQKRVVTPREARDRGASALVIGRPITKANDPAEAARAIAGTL